MSLAEYESLRSDATTFAVLAGHEIPDVEAVVDERGRYNVVRKLPGRPSEVARDGRAQPVVAFSLPTAT